MSLINKLVLNINSEQLERIECLLKKLLNSEQAEDMLIKKLINENIKLKQELKDALSGTTLPPAAQAKLDEIYATLSKDSAAIRTALSTEKPSTDAKSTGL